MVSFRDQATVSDLTKLAVQALRPSIVRRGSTVRVRQRASRSPCKWPACLAHATQKTHPLGSLGTVMEPRTPAWRMIGPVRPSHTADRVRNTLENNFGAMLDGVAEPTVPTLSGGEPVESAQVVSLKAFRNSRPHRASSETSS
jgi:hypothetical protein